MTFKTTFNRLASTALVAAVALSPLSAQTTGDPTGSGTATGGPTPTSTGVHVVSPELFELMKSWSTTNATLEGIALAGFPDALELYARDLDSHFGGLSRHVAQNYPATHALFVEATGFDPEIDVASLLGFMINQDGDSYLSMMRGLASARMDFSSWADQNYPILARELALVKSPRDEGIPLGTFVYDAGGYEVLDELGTSLGLAAYPDDDCACWLVVEDFETDRSGDINDESNYESWYKFPNVKVRDWEYSPIVDGAEKSLYYDRRSRNITFTLDRSIATRSTLEVMLHCTQGNDPSGPGCTLGSCGAQASVLGRYGSKTWKQIHSAGIKLIGNNATVNATDVANLELRINGQIVADNHVNEKGTSEPISTNNPRADAKGIAQGMVGPVISLVWDIIQSGGDYQQALLNWLLDGDAAGVVKYAIDGNDEEFHVKDDQEETLYWYVDGDGSFTILPGNSYELSMITSTAITGTGFGDNNWSRAAVDTAYFLALAHKNYTCTPGVHPPQPGGAWMWGAAPSAPLDAGDLQGEIKSFFDDQLMIDFDENHLGDKTGDFAVD